MRSALDLPVSVPERERIAENVRALNHALEVRKRELTITWPLALTRRALTRSRSQKRVTPPS
jgi:hypothetical protein